MFRLLYAIQYRLLRSIFYQSSAEKNHTKARENKLQALGLAAGNNEADAGNYAADPSPKSFRFK